MAIEDSPLYEEIKIIHEEGRNPVHGKWSCVLITPEDEIKPLKFISIDIERDYLNNFADKVILDIALPKGLFTHNVIPFAQELLVEIKREPIPESHEPVDEEPVVKIYRAVLGEVKDEAMEGMGPETHTRFDGNISDIVRLSIQLIPLAVEELRLHKVGGIYRGQIPGDLVRYILTHVSEKLNLPDEEKIVGVDKVDWDNQTPNRNIIIPQGTDPQNIAALIQDDWGGVYNAGIGCYLQDNLWYLWPEFNFERYDQEERVLQVINVPPLRYRGMERTWRLDEYKLVVVSTGETQAIDRTHHIQLDVGNATRFSHTDQMWKHENEFGKNFGESTKDNKFHWKRSDNNSEWIAIDRPNYNVAPLSPRRLTNNSFAESSMMSKRKGLFMTFTWEHSRPEYIYPGMQTRLMFLKNDEVMEHEAVVVKAHHFIHDNRPGLVEHRHICNTAITLFVNKEPLE